MITQTDNYKEKLLITSTLFGLFEILMRAQNDEQCTVFFELSGHCELLTVRMYAPNWIENTEPTFREEAYINGQDEKCAAKLLELRSKVINYINSLSC